MRGIPPAPGGVAPTSPTSFRGGAFWGEVTVHVQLDLPNPNGSDRALVANVALALSPILPEFNASTGSRSQSDEISKPIRSYARI
jgi:hypothetical protein